MNAHARVTAEDAIADAIADEITAELKIIEFEGQEPEVEAEALADVHRRRVDRHDRRIAHTRSSLKIAVADLEAQRKAVKAKFDTDMAEIAEKIATARDKAARDIAADKRMAAASKAALDILLVE